MAEVFISYSRRDKEFVKRLHTALSEQGRDTWVDWEDIPLTADWWQEIQQGIEAADTFVFILSPDSAASKVCGQEVEHAVAHNKRLVPIVHREGFQEQQVHPAIRKHNWLFFREQDEFDQAFAQLGQAIDLDIAYAHQHTRLLVRAKEWEAQERNPDLLVRGIELEAAIHWLTQNVHKQPKATLLQQEYVETSHRVERDRQLAEIKRQQMEIQQQRRWLAAVTCVSVMAIGAALIAFSQYREATRQKVNAQLRALSATAEGLLLLAHQDLDGLIGAVRGGQLLRQQGGWVDAETRLQTILTLQQALGQVREANRLEGHQFSVNDASFSPDGQTIASASDDKTVRLWNREGKFLKTWVAHEGGINALQFSPDGQTLATASSDGTVRLWNREGKLLQTLKGHQNKVRSVQFSPDGRSLLSAGDDQTLRLWNQNGQLLKTFAGHKGWVNQASFSPDGQRIVSASNDQTIRLWSRDGQLLRTLTGMGAEVRDARFSPDGQFLLASSVSGRVQRWSVAGKLLGSWGLPGMINAIRFSPKGQLAAIALEDGTVHFWQPNGKPPPPLQGHADRVNRASFSPDGRFIVTASTDNTLRLWNLTPAGRSPLTRLQSDLPNRARLSPDGQLLASVEAPGQSATDSLIPLQTRVRLRSLRGDDRGSIQVKGYKIDHVEFSPDGQTLATVGQATNLDNALAESGIVRRWGLDGNLIQTLPNLPQNLNLRFSPDGQTLILFADETVQLLSLQGGTTQILKGHSQMVWDASFSPDGQTLVSGGDDFILRWWNRQGQSLATLVGHTDRVTSVSFNPTGTVLLSTSSDGTLRLWNRSGPLLNPLRSHRGRVNAAQFSPDGSLIASAGEDSTVKLWGSRSGMLLKTLPATGDSVVRVQFSADGKNLFAISLSNQVQQWSLDLEASLKTACAWLQPYLTTNPGVSKADRDLCL